MTRSLLASTALLLAALGCNTSPSGQGGNTGAPQPTAPTAVSPVMSRKLQTTISLPAQLVPFESVDIYPRSLALCKP